LSVRTYRGGELGVLNADDVVARMQAADKERRDFE
jgi:hypothetical protein